jgi:hypothetical protein
VVDWFTESWAPPAQSPVVRAVYKIALTRQSLDTYLGYRFVSNDPLSSQSAWLMTSLVSDTLEYYGQFNAQGKPNGNERKLWHGTRRSCNLGETGQTTPCMIPRCSLCSIIQGSFDIDTYATHTPAGRFGIGIYTSTKASKYVHPIIVAKLTLTYVACLQGQRLLRQRQGCRFTLESVAFDRCSCRT